MGTGPQGSSRCAPTAPVSTSSRTPSPKYWRRTKDNLQETHRTSWWSGRVGRREPDKSAARETEGRFRPPHSASSSTLCIPNATTYTENPNFAEGAEPEVQRIRLLPDCPHLDAREAPQDRPASTKEWLQDSGLGLRLALV